MTRTSTSVLPQEADQHVVDEVFPCTDADDAGRDGTEDERVGEFTDDGRADQPRPQVLSCMRFFIMTRTREFSSCPTR